MGFINQVFGCMSKEYITGIDCNGAVTTQRLNIFERVARDIFGWYEETHLKNALKKITAAATRENFTFADGEALKVMGLFSKVRCMEGPCAGSFDEAITLVSHTTVDGKRKYAIRYRPPEDGRSAGWEIVACLQDCKGMMRLQSMHISGSIEEGIVQIFGGMGSWVNDRSLENEMRENMKQFLIHILHHSPKLRGAQFTRERLGELYGFEAQLVSKEDYAQPDGFDQVPPFSLDFMTQLKV